MGLIRKTLAVSTAGVVRPSSKKQRVAKKTMKASQATAHHTAAAAAMSREQLALTHQQAWQAEQERQMQLAAWQQQQVEAGQRQAQIEGAPAGVVSVAAELRELASLRDEGVLTEAEFQGQKAVLLGTAVPGDDEEDAALLPVPAPARRPRVR